MFDSIFLIVLGIPVGLFLLALTIGMIRDMFPERKSVLEKRIIQLEQELDETQKALEQKEREKQSAIRKAVEDETSDLKDRLYSFTQENTRLNAKLHQLEDKNSRLSKQCDQLTSVISSDKVQRPPSNVTEQTELQILEEKLSRIEDFCPSIHKLLSGDVSPAEYELILIDRVPFYSSAGEVNNLPVTKAEPPSPPFAFGCESVRPLYRRETQENRLNAARSERISTRFLSPISINVQNPLSVSVLIAPGKRSKKERKAYTTSLSQCSCYDFNNTLKGKAACKHMFALALSLNLINENGDFVNHIPF